jgi:cytochrome c-type biogenesis protein CcsB
MYTYLLNAAIVAYACATGLSFAYLVQRHEVVHRFSSLATATGWAAHTLALVVAAAATGRPPLATLSEAVSVAIWVVVLLAMIVERRSGLKLLGAFVMPVVLVFGLKATVGRPPTLAPALGNAWIGVHIALALIGIAAFVLNFAGALMYLLKERQLKAKRPGAFYYRLPALQTLDHLTYRTLALGFPFLTVALLLGAAWARTAWGSVFTFDPLALLSFVAWTIYAGTLAGRSAGGWHGRRAAYFAIIGFAALVLTLGAGLFLPGRHGT